MRASQAQCSIAASRHPFFAALIAKTAAAVGAMTTNGRGRSVV